MTVPLIPGARVRARHGGRTWQVDADRVPALQALALAGIGHAPVSTLDVTVGRWRPPVAGWLGRPGLPGLAEVAIEPRGHGVHLRLGVVEPTDPGLLVAAACRCLAPYPTGDVGPMLTFSPGLPASASCLVGEMHDVLLPGDVRDAHVRRSDVLLASVDDGGEVPARAVTLVLEQDRWIRDGQSHDVSIDPTVHRPIGRRSIVDGAIATAVDSGNGRVLVTTSAGGATARVAIDGVVRAAEAMALRGTRAIVADHLPDAIHRQLSACGIVVAGPGQALPDLADHLAWQAWSVHERRHALRAFGPSAALDDWPTVSIVLVTNRPDHLAHAFGMLGRLRYPRLEVVVGIHGPAVDGARAWELAQGLAYPASVVGIDGALSLGEALQSASARAEGALITKMDDDDVYGPEHIWDLVLARQYSGAQVVGKALDWIHLEAEDATVFRPAYAAEKYAGFVAGGTMLISRADLAAVGGWRPVPRSVDRALLDRVLADGGLVYRTHGLGYAYVRHSAGHTASVQDAHFLTKTVATYPGLIRHAAFGTSDALAGEAEP